MAVSQKEIARHLGVSQALVGMALNGHPRISPSTRDRVANAASELGYDVNLNQGARQMAAKRHGLRIPNNVIALCTIPTPSPIHQQPFESEVLDGIESEADRCDLDVLQCRMRSSRLPRLIEKREVDGVIMLSGRPEHYGIIQKLKLPIVKIGSHFPAVHGVCAQHYEGVSTATSHLIGLGHRRIAFIGHEVNIGFDESTLVDAAIKRLAGYRATMQKAGLPVEYVDSSLRESYREDGARAFASLWKQSGGTLTAVVCYNDTLAMGVIEAARELGLSVPQDLSVVGFDNVSTRYNFEMPISSVHFNRCAMGRRAVEILMTLRDSNDVREGEYIQEEFPVEFVPGATTAPPRNNRFKN